MAFALWLSLSGATAHALNELFPFYSAPQGLAMGNALTADAFGYLSNYYNPAGLAKMPRRKTEVHFIALEGVNSFGSIGKAIDSQSLSWHRMLGPLRNNPGDYVFYRYSAIPAISIRGFSISMLANYQFAGLSDGTMNDLDARFDLGPSVGYARNFAGNLLKIGISGKFFVRNQLKGNFANSALTSKAAIDALSKEGYGIGFNAGMLLTLPFKYLPSFGVVVKDVLDTNFIATNLLNSSASGAPDSIPRSIHAAISLRPRFSRALRTTIAVEMKHIELFDLPLRKKLHIGLQLQSLSRKQRFFIWLGLNQLNPTGGIGLRMPGGNLEIGTYAQDIGAGETAEADRRFFFRYTVSFY